ncbi:MAG: alpha/beta fold hydrolase [Candidatus Saccharimonadia bacterium]
MPVVKVDDINMYYEILGVGEQVVLIPGLGTDITEYKRIIESLAKKYQVITADNRGSGRSDKPKAPYTIEMMADDLAGLLRKIGVNQVNVLGISMGGRIAQALALKHPDLVKRLILASTSARFIRRRRITLFGLVRRLPLARSKYPQPNYAFEYQRQATARFDNKDRLHDLRVPTLILHGRKDGIAPYYLAEEMNNGIKGSKLVTFAGGHLFMFMREQKRFISEVEKFVGSV